jgi:thiol-disulfide isomerase/thioredoxin
MKTISLLILLAFALSAQTVGPCEAAPALERELRDPALVDPQTAFSDRWAAFHDLLRKDPDNVFVHRRYQDWLSGNETLTMQERQVTEYESAYQADPNNPVNGYLYARILIRRDYEKAVSILTGLAASHPENPGLHLELAGMRSSPSRAKVRDDHEARHQLDEYLALCPATLDAAALPLIQKLGDRGLWEQTAHRMRPQLESRDDPAAVAAWPQLWQWESMLLPAAEQEKARQQKRDDLRRIRALHLTGLVDWYTVMRDGYSGLNDAEGQKWADAQLLRDMPGSSVAFNLTSREWWRAHTTETGMPSGPAEARNRELMRATADWIARWPNQPEAWHARLRAVEGLSDIPEEVVEQTAGRLLAVTQRSPDAILGTVPPELDIAKLRLARGLGMEQIPVLIQAADREVETRYQVQRKIQYGVWGDRAYLERYRWDSHWEGQRVLFDFYRKTGQSGKAMEVLAALQESVAGVDPGDLLSQADGWPRVVDMALAAGQLDKARAALVRLESFLAENRPKAGEKPNGAISGALQEGPYWNSSAKLAEAEGRKLDAVSFYLNSNSKGDPEAARQLWTALGGSERGWTAMVSRTLAKMPAQANETWQTLDRALPDFALEDVGGKKLRLSDLKGRTVFVNVWATWCAPCREELPAVEKLYQSLKDRKDVAVLTLNADENAALVKPFLERTGFTFPVVLASEYVFQTLGIASIPVNWVMDKGGVVRAELLNRSFLSAEALPMLEKVKEQ